MRHFIDNGRKIIINSVADLSVEEAIELKKNNLTMVKIKGSNECDLYHEKDYTEVVEQTDDTFKGFNPWAWIAEQEQEKNKAQKEERDFYEYSSHPEEPYNIDTYIAVRSKLDELIENIEPSLSDEKKFAIIYSRICKSIVYDYPAAYPKGESEKEYSQKHKTTSRNLKNGLLYGKCVCAGYADILRASLELVGVEAYYISGPTITGRKNEEKQDDKGIEQHAWVKLKLDGKWYNADPTWDTDPIRNGLNPIYALKTDEEYIKMAKRCRDCIPGPKCETVFPSRKTNQLFGDNSLYIGNVRIPNLKDIKGIVLLTIEAYKELFENIIRHGKNIGEKLFLSKKIQALPSPNTEEKKIEDEHSIPQSDLPSWDLRRWNMTMKDYNNLNNNENHPDQVNIKNKENHPKQVNIENKENDER